MSRHIRREGCHFEDRNVNRYILQPAQRPLVGQNTSNLIVGQVEGGGIVPKKSELWIALQKYHSATLVALGLQKGRKSDFHDLYHDNVAVSHLQL